MSEYPDKVLLHALEELSKKKRKTRWPLPRYLLSKLADQQLGDTTMVFSLFGGGIPLLSSVYVPWSLVWESLCSRMRRGAKVFVGSDNRAYDCSSDEGGIVPQKGLCLVDIDEAIAKVSGGDGYERPIVSVECGPCTPYTFQLINCYGFLCVVVRTSRIDVGDRYELGWMLTESGMLAQYCAARIGVQADRMVFTASSCYLPRGIAFGKKEIGPCAYIRQPRVCFGRVAKTSRDCYPGDLFVNGYMRVSKSVCAMDKVCGGKTVSSMNRTMSVGQLISDKFRVGFRAPKHTDSDLPVKSAYF